MESSQKRDSTGGTGKIRYPACDACRIRKIKCDAQRANPQEPEAERKRCTPCAQLDVPCTFRHKTRRPGPAPGYRKRMAQTFGEEPQRPKQLPFPTESSRPSYSTPSSGHASELFGHPSGGAFDPSPSEPTFSSFNDLASLLSPVKSTSAHRPLFPPRLDENLFAGWLPRTILNQVIDLHFQYPYNLVPFPHEPSFRRDLANRREEQNGEEEWKTMVIMLVGACLVQVPHQLLSPPIPGARELVKRCFHLGRKFLSEEYNDFTINRSCIIASVGIIALNQGSHAMARELFGANIALMLSLELDREQTYVKMAPIDREMHRRYFWLMYGGDRAGACAEGERVMMDQTGTLDILLPSELDDQFIHTYGLLEPPPGYESRLSALYHTSRLWQGLRRWYNANKVAGQIMFRQEMDRKSLPTGDALRLRILDADELVEQVANFMETCPPYLQLDLDRTNDLSVIFGGMASRLPNADDLDLSQWLDFDDSPTRAFQVQMANMYLSRHAIWLMGVQYRYRLLQARQREEERQFAMDQILHQGRLAPPQLRDAEAVFKLDRDRINTELLLVLHKLPLELIAVSSLPGVSKIRFVASTLLTELESPSPDGGSLTASIGLDNGTLQAYLTQYLLILARVESLYQLPP